MTNGSQSDNLDLNLEDLGRGEGEELSQMFDAEKQKRLIIISEKKYMKYLTYAGAGMLLTSFIVYVAYIINSFYSINLKDTQLDDSEIEFIADYKSKQQTVYGMVGISEDDTNFSAFDPNLEDVPSMKNNVQDYISDKSVSYINKKDTLTQYMSSLSSQIKSYSDSLTKIKSDISKYSFLPKEVDDTISDNEIQKSILSVESIKFFTALNVFSHLRASVKELAEYLGADENSVKKIIDSFVQRGESDTQRYLMACYLNPYEREQGNDVCNYIDDFSNFYLFSNSVFDSRTFKRIMTYLDQKLEFSTLSRLSIVLNQLDPKSNTIGFSIEVNTLNEDENDMISSDVTQGGTPNIHIFIVSNIIKLLRQSHFIMGSDIKMNDLKITKKKVKVGEGDVVVNNSSFNFTIPIQKSVEREIYDFVYSK